MNVKTEICKAFNAQAGEYEQAAKVQHDIGLELLGRLQYLKINPRYILDLGCGTGVFSEQLKKLYPRAQVIGFDLALSMLQEAKAKQGWLKKWGLVNGDMNIMPFATGLFDLVFANQVIHWSSSLPMLMRELNRVMHVNSCLMFTTLGPDTFLELRQAWASVDSHAHTNVFSDMHDVGDVLLAERFIDPVMDMEMLNVHYSNLSQLIHALKAQGVRNINTGRNPGLTGRQAWRDFEAAYAMLRTAEGHFPLSYEVVYGHAWKGEQRRTEQGLETLISVEGLRKNR